MTLSKYQKAIYRQPMAIGLDSKVFLYQFATSIDSLWMLRDINDIRRTNAAQVIEEQFENDHKLAAAAMGTQPSFIGRLLRADAAGKRNIGDSIARRLEQIGQKPLNWLDHDHSRMSPQVEALVDRFNDSPPDVRALIQLALDDPNTPLPESMRPSLKTMIEGVRMALRQHIQQ